MARAKKDRERGWFTRAEMAAIFGVSEQHFDRGLARFAPAAARVKEGNRVLFQARPLIDAWAAAQSAKAAPEPTAGDPLLAGSGNDTPALEEYRRQMARIKRVEADKAELLVVPIAEVRPALMQLGAVVRRAGESLARAYGNDAAGLVNEAVSEWEAGCEALLSREPASTELDPRLSESDAGAAAADGPAIRRV